MKKSISQLILRFVKGRWKKAKFAYKKPAFLESCNKMTLMILFFYMSPVSTGLFLIKLNKITLC